MKYLVLTLALSALLFQGCAKNQGDKKPPGANGLPAAGTGVPKGTPPPASKTNSKTVLEGNWSTNAFDGITRTMRIKDDVMEYEVIDQNDDQNYSLQQFYITVTAKANGDMTQEVDYYDSEGYFLFTEYAAVDATPPSIRIGAGPTEWQRYHKN